MIDPQRHKQGPYKWMTPENAARVESFAFFLVFWLIWGSIIAINLTLIDEGRLAMGVLSFLGLWGA